MTVVWATLAEQSDKERWPGARFWRRLRSTRSPIVVAAAADVLRHTRNAIEEALATRIADVFSRRQLARAGGPSPCLS